eukprot:CAMPEP_0119127202 /NCGR_PEP_ID=MMETSP1310-20130426/5844_1 /TAXON_ID=464262 /ORGANISM="Genus nov. species nov., Strain RCC2339" /LENGTH=345 /DNA_ID=CAMNT_0007117441 /DNA_START=159 /DNA_END=1195 /DNA_ORIENTATION=+
MAGFKQLEGSSLPPPGKVVNGEAEGDEFFVAHNDTISRAWEEFLMERGGGGSCLKYHAVRAVDAQESAERQREENRGWEERYVREELREAIQRIAQLGEPAAEEDIMHLFDSPVPGVIRSANLFTSDFLQCLQDELEQCAGAGIPLRRPNGMNRYGLILDSEVPGGVGYLSPMVEALVQNIVRPVASLLFPGYMMRGDVDAHYAFSVRYKVGQDVHLAEHRDASVVTMNLCLGVNGFQGSSLYFGTEPERDTHFEDAWSCEGDHGDRHFVPITPGTVLFHRGSQQHGALPLTRGERVNLVMWLYGSDGSVRFAPYENRSDWMTFHDRWEHLFSSPDLIHNTKSIT